MELVSLRCHTYDHCADHLSLVDGVLLEVVVQECTADAGDG